MPQNYNPENFPFKENYLELIEIAVKIHKILGFGLTDKAYKDAFEIELKSSGIQYLRERRYNFSLNGMILDHKFHSDFLVNDAIIVEIKSVPFLISESELKIFCQLITPKPRIGMVINFHYEVIQFEKVILM